MSLSMHDNPAASELQSRLAAIVESSNDAIMSQRPDGTIVSWNKAGEDVYGFSSSEMLGRNARTLFPAGREAENDELIKRIDRGEKVQHFQTTHLHKSGRLVDVSLSLSPIYGADGSIVGIAAIARDITQQLQLQRKLESRSRELARSNAELQNFVHAASHDLKEPLRAVVGYTDLLGRKYGDALDETAKRYLLGAQDGARRMDQLIDDLLRYARIDADLRMNPVDLADCLKSARQSLQVQLADTNADITIGSLPIVQADAGQIRQLFQNLLSNALKFGKSEERLRVEISALRVANGWQPWRADLGGIQPRTGFHIPLHSHGNVA